MKKLIIVSIVVATIFITITKVKAVTIINIDAESIRSRYAGSILKEDKGFEQQYWYVDPKSQERYLLKDGSSVSSLLKELATGINNSNLNKIPEDSEDQIDYELVAKLRGHFLLQVEDNGIAWYLNPLDNYRYQISNGKQGLETLKSLALDIDSTKLSVIPIIKNLDYQTKESGVNFNTYWEIQNILRDNYYQPEKVDDLAMFYGSLRGLADSLNDPYTEFFTPVGKKNFDNVLANAVEGIGAMVDIKDGRLIIISPLDDTPAKQAGLLPNDQILIVDNVDIAGYSLDDAVNLIKGPAGTNVLLTVFRPSTNTLFQITITRAKIQVPNITAHNTNNIAYFKINTFAQNLVSDFISAKNDIVDANTKGIIIDLRNNPGGYTNSAITLADYWVPKEKIILQEQYPDTTIQYTASLEPEITLPTVVLINEGSASASEIFTAALAEHNLATVVGQKSFGKGTGQTLINFEDKSALKYTIFEWLTPNGNSLEDIGIEPDYIVINTDYTDLQLQKAESLLQ